MASISSHLRSGLISITALALLPSAALAGPLAPDKGFAAAGNGGPDKPILVWQGEGRDHGPGYRFWPRAGRNWGGGGHNWGGGRHWGGGWGDRGWDRGHWRHGGHWGPGWGGWGSGFALGLGFGVPLGYYGGYDNYDPGYYDEPVYRPRVYRQRVYRERVYRAPRYQAEPRVYRYPRAQTGPHCDNVYLTGRNFSGCYDR